MPLSRWGVRAPIARRWLLVLLACLVVGVGVVAVVHRPGRPAGPAAAAPTSEAEDEDAPPTAPPPPALVTIRTETGSAVMADAAGYTLYAFSADSPQVSRCIDDCARRWLPLVSSGGKPQAGNGTSLAQIGSIRRADGSYQVTFNDWPLYHFVGDTLPDAHDGAGRTEYGGRWSPAPPSANPT
jgi:predicted lipoprotein with Yx(FWY)xxD motif